MTAAPQKKLLIAIVSHQGIIELAGLRSVIADLIAASSRGWQAEIKEFVGHTILPTARNSAVAVFRASDATDLIMLDVDEGWEAGAICRLASHPVDVVGASFPLKREPLLFPLYCPDGELPQRDPYTGLMPFFVGTGLIRISRRCVERMIAGYPDDWYHDASVPGGKVYELFRHEVIDHRLWGEDLWFCRRYAAIGGETFVDPDIAVEHIGKKSFEGRLADWLKGKTSAQLGNLAAAAKPAAPPPAKIALCIASRGRPQELAATLTACVTTMTLERSRILVALDDDDPTLAESLAVIEARGGDRTFSIVNPRQDSIGAVYNLCAEAIAADLYINGADDMCIVTHGWDAQLAEAYTQSGEVPVVFGFGQMPVADPSQCALPALMAASRPLIELMPHWLQPFTPFWWQDTWLWEVAILAGCYRPIDGITLDYRGQQFITRGLREVNYWQAFFDRTRVMRRGIAERIALRDIAAGALPAARAAYRARVEAMCESLLLQGALLRAPDYVRQFERDRSIEAPADARYARIRANAEAILAALDRATFTTQEPA